MKTLNIKDFISIDKAILVEANRKHHIEAKYSFVDINKVGRNYVYVGNKAFYKRKPSDIYLTEKTNYNATDLLFASVFDYKKWLEENELRQWQWRVKDLTLTVEQLRRMKRIADKME